MMITKEIRDKLSAPFAPQLLKWKIQKNPNDGKEWARVVAYIDARDVCQRLDDALDGDWSDDYALSVKGDGLECKLTCMGVTRKDVGEGSDAKSLYSDALKRAAVKFGVARYIYRFPGVYAKAEKRGKYWVMTKQSEQSLRELSLLLSNKQEVGKLNDVFLIDQPMYEDGTETVSEEPHDEPQAEPKKKAKKAEQGEHPFYTTIATKNISETVQTSILKQAEGDLDRANQLAELWVIQRDNKLPRDALKKVIGAVGDQGFEAEKTVLEILVQIKANTQDMNSILSYFSIAIENGWTVNHATVHLARNNNNITKSIETLAPVAA